MAAKDEAERPKLSVGLPYVQGLSEPIRRILRPLSVGGFFQKPQSWKWTVMKGVKDERKSHEKAGMVYEMRYKIREKTYIGETARSAYIRGKEN